MFDTNKSHHRRRTLAAGRITGWALCVAAAIGTLPHPAHGSGGTPPPFFCGQTYVFASAGDLNVVADRAGTVTIDTLHYLNKISSVFGGCPPATFTLIIDASLTAGDGGIASAQTYGPYSLTEGFTQVTIEVDIPSTSAGSYDIYLTGTVTDGGGYQQSQHAMNSVYVLPPSPLDPNEPIFKIRRAGDHIKLAHPSAGRVFDYVVTNNSMTALDITIAAMTQNVADMPAWFGVVPDTILLGNGPYSVADPGNGDAFPIFWGDDIADFCVPLPGLPHMSTPQEISMTLRVPAGESMPVQLKTRSWPQSGSGATNQGHLVASATFPHTAAGVAAGELTAYSGADFVMAADSSQFAEIFCLFNAGRAANAFATTVPGVGPAIGMFGDASDVPATPFNVNFAFNPAQVTMLVNGVAVTGAQTFVVPSMLDGQFGRMVTEKSFTIPPFDYNDIITFATIVQVPSPPSGQTFQLSYVQPVEGAPVGWFDEAPFANGRIEVQSTVPSVASGVLDFTHQLSATGVVIGTFEQVPMINVSADFTALGPNQYLVTSVWTAAVTGTTPMFGFDVTNDILGFAMPPQPDVLPGDYNQNGVVDAADYVIWRDTVGTTSLAADGDGDGDVDSGDYGVWRTNFGTRLPL